MFWTISPIFILIFILTFLYHFKKDLRRTVIFFGSSLGIGATIVAAILGVLGLNESTQQHSFSIKYNQKQASFSYLKEWKESPQAKAREASRKIRGLPPQEAHKVLLTNDEYADSVRAILAFFEEVGLAVKHSYADEETLCPMLQEPVTTYYASFQPWMDWYKSYRQLPLAFENYEWLNAHWKQGCPRKKTPATEGSVATLSAPLRRE